MGFHVDLEELHKAANKLNQEAGRIETQLTDAKNSVNKIITSEALQGKTGQAIYQQLNNVDAAVLVGLADTSKVLASEFSSLLSSFHSSVGETSNSAVLDEDYFNQLKDNLNNFKNQHGAQEENISSIYASISDLISLSGPQSNYDADSDTASQLLSTTIDKVTSFDSSGTAPTSADLLAAIDTEVNQVSQTTDLPYTDSQYLSFISDVNFAKGIKSVDKQLTEQEKLAKEQAKQKAKKEWAKHHPVEALLQNVNDETTKLFKWANQEVQDFNLNIPGGNYVKDQISLRLGFISKACETIGDLALGATQLSHLTVESIQWGANGQKTAQWIKDDVTSAGMTILTTDIFIKKLQHGDIDAWKAVYKGIENSASQVFHNITSGNTFEIGGYLFDVATLVGPAAVGKLKYVDEASNLAKLAETSEVEKRVEIIDKVKSAFTSGTEIKPGTQIDVVSQKTAGTTIKETVSSVKVPETYLTTAERYDEIPIVEYAQQMSKDYTSADVEELTRLTTHNANSDTALLGPYSPDTSSYEQIAHENGFTYFDAGTNGWNAISEVDGDLAYRVNDEFLQQQIDSGKDIVLTHDPAAAYKTYVESNGGKMVSYNKELNILKKYGYHIVKDGQFWRATK